MVLIGFAVATAIQVVGVLLIFALLVLPAASAQQFTPRPARSILYGILIAIACVWAGLLIGFYLPYPPSFFITTLAFLVYVVTYLLGPARLARTRGARSTVVSVSETKILRQGAR
jgi:zinc/manganese transport system permease protein